MMRIDEATTEQLLEENSRRNESLRRLRRYDPVKGTGCYGQRIESRNPADGSAVYLPETMLRDKEYSNGMSPHEWTVLRLKHDFEFWCATCVTVRHKTTGQMMRLTLNYPQRRLLAAMEQQRLAGMPVRVILLKARQWGGSTLVQMYFAWMQCCRRKQWHSLICAHVKDTAATIRGMYATMLADYPEHLWLEDEKPRLTGYEGSANIKSIPGRDCRITTTSAMSPESVRGLDCSMAHLSEVAFWKDADTMSPEMLVQSVCGGIPLITDTVVVMESTANGVGNFFHRAWCNAKNGDSDYAAVFVPWYEIDIYSMEVKDPENAVKELDSYERMLWDQGLTLEQIWWYHRKRREMHSDTGMHAEYPTTDIEAFDATGRGVFDADMVERMRPFCAEPIARGEVCGTAPKGDVALQNIRFTPSRQGELEIWEFPVRSQKRHRYVVAVDVGGRSETSDWSVIAVLDRLGSDGTTAGPPKVVAQWRGHIDHDLLAWKAAAIARWYCEALLVVESNSLETDADTDSGMVLELLAQNYRSMYVRRSLDTVTQRETERVGFHTNRATKALIIDNLLGYVRDGTYVERDTNALDELLTYERLPNGSYAARQGCHDDILMTRAIALYVISTIPPSDFKDGDRPVYMPRM